MASFIFLSLIAGTSIVGIYEDFYVDRVSRIGIGSLAEVKLGQVADMYTEMIEEQRF